MRCQQITDVWQHKSRTFAMPGLRFCQRSFDPMIQGFSFFQNSWAAIFRGWVVCPAGTPPGGGVSFPLCRRRPRAGSCAGPSALDIRRGPDTMSMLTPELPARHKAARESRRSVDASIRLSRIGTVYRLYRRRQN